MPLFTNVGEDAFYNTGPKPDCANRKHLRAARIEEQVWGFVRGLLQDPELIRAGLDRLILIAEERTNAGRDPGWDAELWSRKVTEPDLEWRGYDRLAVKGHMTDEELAATPSELWTRSGQTSEHELEAARAMDEALERLKHDRDSLPESYAVMIRETLEDLNPEERHRI